MEKNKPASPAGRTGKYLKYAIGEIILVVIGILIALSLNNWNENRKNKISEKDLLENMLGNLKLDSITFNKNLQEAKSIDSLHRQLYNIGVKGIKDINLKNPNRIRRALDFYAITKNNDPFVTEKIKNKKVRNEVISYFISLDKMEESFDLLTGIIIKNLRPYLGEKELLNLSAIFESDYQKSDGTIKTELITTENLEALSKVPEFQQILFESNLKLSDAEYYLKLAIIENNNLKTIIQSELKDNY
tara:strand:- start:822 stop:1559 length:738 start_codon:yes stop_codon:yes gene_type:complete